MREMDEYGLKLCRYQAELFEESVGSTECSSKIFLRRFMLSDAARRMDADGFLLGAIDKAVVLDEIERQFGQSDYGKVKFSTEEMYWIGYIYRYWAYTKQKSSIQVYRIIKPDELRHLYYPYHSLDPGQTIERIIEQKNMGEEDEIHRGVEILKRVRAKRRQ